MILGFSSQSRTWGLIAALSVAISGIVATTSCWADSVEKPNVIVLLADDLGWSDVGFHGEDVIETPSIDRLAREGMELGRFYTTPICSPTRAALYEPAGTLPMRGRSQPMACFLVSGLTEN